MKSVKVTLAVAASALLLAAPAMAFHTGGVADCDGCHTMHNSNGGVTMNGGTLDLAGPYLLQTGGGNGQASDACLNCHDNSGYGSYHIMTPVGQLSAAAGVTRAKLPIQRTPGGDFGWIAMFTIGPNDTAGNPTAAPVAFGGHNVRGENHGLGSSNASGIYSKFGGDAGVGPGGSYPVSNLQCSSCHDPHGKYRRTTTGVVLPSDNRGVAGTGGSLPIMASGSYATSPLPSATAAVGVYRILGGANYLPKSLSLQTGLKFVNDPPLAVAPGTYNFSESAGQTKVAYGQGMSEWCANCHGALLSHAGVSANAADGGHTHPAGSAVGSLNGGWADSTNGNSSILGNYNAYISSGNLGGTSASSYESLVPYEEGTASTFAGLQGIATINKTNPALSGPSAGAQAMCLSCHRAHATGFDSMLRYDISGEFMTIQDTVGGATPAYSTVADINTWKLAAYNDKPASRWGTNQRVLCNKCHAKD